MSPSIDWLDPSPANGPSGLSLLTVKVASKDISSTSGSLITAVGGLSSLQAVIRSPIKSTATVFNNRCDTKLDICKLFYCSKVFIIQIRRSIFKAVLATEIITTPDFVPGFRQY